MNEKTIDIQGKGVVTDDPDLIILTLIVDELEGAYSEAIGAVNRRTTALKDDLAAVDVPADQVKTTNFTVDTEYKRTDGKRKFQGYRAEHRMELELPMDRERTSQVLNVLVRSDSAARFTIDLAIEDKAELRQTALREAVADAKRKAETLSTAAGVQLGDIAHIAHGWKEIRVRREVTSDPQVAQSASVSMPDINPSAIEVNERVTITWMIGGSG